MQRPVSIALFLMAALLAGGAIAAAVLNRYVYENGININMKAWVLGAFGIIAVIALVLLALRVTRRARRS